LTTPPGAKVIAYRSGDLPLKAFVDPPPADGKKHRALVFCHGGFSFGADDWTMPQPFRDAGFVVMVPILRGENGQPGSFSTFYYEVDDVLAAADALTTLPYVDPKQVFISGHSAGGTLTLLAAMASPRFRGAASLSASVDQAAFAEGRPELVAYDPSSDAEVEMRSPLAFSTSLRSPTRMYYGNLERWAAWPTAKLAHGAKEARLDVESVEVPGDHFTSVPPGIREAIRFFDGL
jgi:dipeptidyl aminopeptidase/acylaminoacyl peptidase